MMNQANHFSCFILGSNLLKKVDFSVEMGNFNLLLDFFEKTCPSMAPLSDAFARKNAISGFLC